MYCNLSYPNKILATTTLSNSSYPNLTFSTTTRPGIISPLFPNLIASISIWTIYKGPTSGRAILTLTSNSQTPIFFDAQVIYTGASYDLRLNFGNAIFVK